MSGTRSPSPKAPATEALIVSHGQPSDPEPAEAWLAEQAARVQALLPDWRIGSATLAAPGSLERSLAGSDGLPFIYPLFMTAGWFTQEALPARLGMPAGRVLAPFGSEPALPAVAVQLLRDTARTAGWNPAQTEILLAAHGSANGPRPAACTQQFAAEIAASGAFGAVRVGFLEESPGIDDVAMEFGSKAICLPYFAAHGSHVTEDLPGMLRAGGFRGPVLPPAAQWPGAPALIAAAISAAARSEQAA